VREWKGMSSGRDDSMNFEWTIIDKSPMRSSRIEAIPA
jgi:hypothetical protein